jgi:uncharacterized protein involved in high-affinity Fe2+ transport
VGIEARSESAVGKYEVMWEIEAKSESAVGKHVVMWK